MFEIILKTTVLFSFFDHKNGYKRIGDFCSDYDYNLFQTGEVGMANFEKTQEFITEEMVEKFFQLNKQAKEIDKELSRLKKAFNQYFDLTVGENQKGVLTFESFEHQRQIRVAEKFREEETVKKLEEMNLTDCIKVVKQVDEEKVKAAVTLGILPAEILTDYKDRKHIPVIAVKER